MKYTIVKDEDRENFIPELVGMDMRMLIQFENSIYSKMDESDPTYKGGRWDFIVFENGARAVVLLDKQKVKVTHDMNYFSGEMTRFSLTIAINMFVCSHLSFLQSKGAESVGENYHLLYEALDEDEQEEKLDLPEIFGFLD